MWVLLVATPSRNHILFNSTLLARKLLDIGIMHYKLQLWNSSTLISLHANALFVRKYRKIERMWWRNKGATDWKSAFVLHLNPRNKTALK